MSDRTSSFRPQPDAKTKLESRDRGGFDPHLTRQQTSHQTVVNSGLSCYGANASATDDPAETEGHDAQVFSDRITTGLVRPGGAALARSVASRPDHAHTVGDAQDSASTWQGAGLEVRSTLACGVSYPHLDEEVAARIMQYTPRIPAEEWAPIAHFVRDSVAQAGPDRVDTAKNWLNAVGLLAHYCHHVACLELDVPVVFHADSIERFVQQMATDRHSTKATYRARLFAVAERLVGHQEQSHLRSEISRWEPADAYTAEEVDRLLFTRSVLGTEYRRVNMGVLMSLGFGAGLTSGEMLQLRQQHITRDRGMVVVTVAGSQRRGPRVVPVLARWEAGLAGVLDPQDRCGKVLLPNRHGDTATRVSNFLCACAEVTDVPNMWRMRATWIVAHLNGGTPLPDLVEAAGVDSLTKFERFLPHLARLADSERLTRLRNVEVGR